MFLYSYATGQLRWSDTLDINVTYNLIQTGALISVADCGSKRALAKIESNRIAWFPVHEIVDAPEEIEEIE